MIPGTIVRPLKRLADERGYLMGTMRLDWPDVFKNDAMSFVSMSYPDVIRACHAHPRTKQRDSFVGPARRIRAVTGIVDGVREPAKKFHCIEPVTLPEPTLEA